MKPFNFQILIGLILLYFIPASSVGQEYLFDYQRITTDDGLAHLNVKAVHKSKQGVLWLSNNYGLNRYDGENFLLYTKEDHGLTYNGIIEKIEETEEGLLWLHYISKYGYEQTLEGIDVFNPITQEVVPFDEFYQDIAPFKLKDIQFTQTEDFRNRIITSTKTGDIYLLENQKFKKVYNWDVDTIKIAKIDEANNLWVGNDEKVLKVNTTGKVICEFAVLDRLYAIYTDKEKGWIVTDEELLIKNKKCRVWEETPDGTFKEISFIENGESLLKSYKGNAVCRTKSGLWLVKIKNRIVIFDTNYNIIFDTNDLGETFISVDVLKIIADGSKLWMTSSMGLIKLNISKNPFLIINPNFQSLDNRGLAENADGTIFFINGAIHQYSPKSKEIIPLTSSGGASSLLHLDSILLTGIVSKDVVLEYNLSTQKETLYQKPSVWRKTVTATCFYQFPNQNKLLIGTEKGLGYLYPATKKIEDVVLSPVFSRLDSTTIYNFCNTPLGLMISTDDGIFLMNEKEEITYHFNKSNNDLPINKIRHIYIDNDQTYWLSTIGGGIVKWQPELTKPSIYHQFTKKDGLSNDYIYAIYEDDFGNLWATSDKGLMCIEKSTFRIRSFFTADGLPHNEFNFASHYQTKDGRFYFGGLGGIITFHPKDLVNQNTEKIPLIFSKLSILESNKETTTDITNQLYTSTPIKLQSSDKFIEIYFKLLDFEPAEFHQYQYKIEGYNEFWTTIGESYIRINNLPYGNYIIKVRGQHMNKGWSDRELALPIKVLKPFYLQWWFVLLMLVLISSLIIYYVNWRIANLQKQQFKLEEEVAMRTKQLLKDKQTILQQAEALQSLDKAKTRFFSNITHEFRTPLTLITGPLEQLIYKRPPANILQSLYGILSNAKHLEQLINQLLDLSKIESGRMEIEVTHGDLVKYSQEMINRMQFLAQKKSINLHFECAETIWETNFDKEKWNKIVLNLVSNAIKFTPIGGEVIFKLSKIVYQHQEGIGLSVSDTGIGIEEEKIKKIFNRFYQIDGSTTRLQEGTGIGLSLIKELIELQGGTISVQSAIKKGTTFEVQLPVLQAENAKELLLTELQIAPPTPIIKPTSSQKGIPISTPNNDLLELLLIEDNAEMRAYIMSCIDQSKYKITEAENGEEGIEKAKAIIPDLIISDVMMPLKDGFEVTKAVRENLATSHIPLILLTAKASLESRLEGLRRGADAYLTKPFSPQELALRIQKLIEIRKMLQLLFNGNTTSSLDDTFKKENEFIQNLRQYILDNLDNTELNGEILGKQFAMSRNHLHRKLKALTDLSARDFIRKIRLEKAVELLKTGNYNMSEIAYNTGFSSPSSFSKNFKKAYGKPPSEVLKARSNLEK